MLHVAWGATEKICLPTPANGRQHSDFRLSSYPLFHYAFCCNCGRGIQELLNSGASSQAGDCSLHWQFTQFTLVHTVMWVFIEQIEKTNHCLVALELEEEPGCYKDTTRRNLAQTTNLLTPDLDLPCLPRQGSQPCSKSPPRQIQTFIRLRHLAGKGGERFKTQNRPAHRCWP